MRAPLHALALALCAAALGCTPPPRPDAQARDEAPPTSAGTTQSGAKATTDAPPAGEATATGDAAGDSPLGSARRGDPDFIEAEPGPPLTEEEKALIAADPATLTKEQRRARAYAQRKKLMLTPDTPEAQAILRGAKALREGTMTIPSVSEATGGELTLPAPKTPTEAGGAAPATPGTSE